MSNRKNGSLMELINNPERSSWPSLLERPTQSFETLEATVKQLFDEVKRTGDKAVRKYSSLFDNVALDTFVVSNDELDQAESQINADLKAAILLAKNNIENFHKAQFIAPIRVETMEGVTCWREQKPIEKVGLYIPGGTAPLFSTVLMLAIPAVLAGCKEIILCSPPNENGQIHPAILYAAQCCGVDKIYKIA